MKSKEKKDMDASVKGYNSLLNGGYGGYAKANGLTDYTARLQNMLGGTCMNKSFNFTHNGYVSCCYSSRSSTYITHNNYISYRS